MATRTVRVHLRDGEEIRMEVDEPEDYGVQPVSLPIDPDTGAIDFRGALAGVRTAATELAEAIRDLAAPPDSFEISFGVKLSGSLGAIIAKASSEANFTVKLAWKRPG